MKQVGFLGGGKIGKKLISHILEENLGDVVFVEDPFAAKEGVLNEVNLIRNPDEALYQKADLVVECANASVLASHLDLILSHADLMMLSATAFSDDAFLKKAEELCRQYHRKIYLPHGAILGLDGIFDGRTLWKKVTIETIKNPKSLGRTDTEKTVVYEGGTRGACIAYPRNVNVHASIAMAGIGFDRTISKIVSDPDVSTNRHVIRLEGDGIAITMDVTSFAGGAVTGAYTPTSACGSLDRILKNEEGIRFV